MLIPYRYWNDTIYIQPMLNRPEDKENILAARKDWRADGIDGSSDGEWDFYFVEWLQNMSDCYDEKVWGTVNLDGTYKSPTREQAIAAGVDVSDNAVLPRSFYPNHYYFTEMIYEKTTNKFIGFTRNWTDGTKCEHIVTCFVPEMRGKGFHKHYSVISCKMWFLYSGGELITSDTIRGQSSYYVENPNIEVFKRRDDRAYPVDYIRTEITKESYLAWMDKSENHADRDEPITVRRFFEE